MLPTSSSTKIAYDLRPSKQAERYILVEFLHKLREIGIRMEEYRYVGFGAQYFYDFRLFHQFLGIRDLTSVEGSPLESVQKRCEFNKPYGDLELVLRLSTDYLRDASPDHNYLIGWTTTLDTAKCAITIWPLFCPNSDLGPYLS
jgi:hypothetical protein